MTLNIATNKLAQPQEVFSEYAFFAIGATQFAQCLAPLYSNAAPRDRAIGGRSTR
jgi:hypothetical protein